MGKKTNVDFTKFEWEAPASQLGFIFQSLIFWVFDLFWNTNILAPYGFKIPLLQKSPSKKSLEVAYRTWLVEIGKMIGLEVGLHPKLLFHWRRIQTYNQIGVILTSFLVMGVLIFTIELLTRMFFDYFVSLAILAGRAYYPGLNIITFAFFGILFQISKRFLASILIRYYADSLTVVTAFYLILELLRKDVLDVPSNRRRLQRRLHQLGRNLSMLAYQFESESAEGQRWVASHFKSMEHYVRERERMIVAPAENSLEKLRQDFYELLKILIGGNYGEFSSEAPLSIEGQSTKTNLAVGAILGFVGFLIPASLLYILYVYPQQIVAMGFELNTVGLIALAWLLLTIDATLKLGIVERITGLAKTIRDLS